MQPGRKVGDFLYRGLCSGQKENSFLSSASHDLRNNLWRPLHPYAVFV